MTGPKLEGIAPIVPVRDLARSLPFYTGTLGFTLKTHAPGNDFALLSREGAGIILLGGADEPALHATANNISAYIWTDDLDGLWSELAPRLAGLPEGRVRAPFTQDYGMREFHVKDPDGFLLFFGQESE